MEVGYSVGLTEGDLEKIWYLIDNVVFAKLLEISSLTVGGLHIFFMGGGLTVT